MALTALEDLLKASMGLSAASIGPAAIARAVHERLAVCRLADPHAYLASVLASPAELAGADRGRGRAGDLFFRRQSGSSRWPGWARRISSAPSPAR